VGPAPGAEREGRRDARCKRTSIPALMLSRHSRNKRCQQYSVSQFRAAFLPPGFRPRPAGAWPSRHLPRDRAAGWRAGADALGSVGARNGFGQPGPQQVTVTKKRHKGCRRQRKGFRDAMPICAASPGTIRSERLRAGLSGAHAPLNVEPGAASRVPLGETRLQQRGRVGRRGHGAPSSEAEE
jgi:hypothetical protein